MAITSNRSVTIQFTGDLEYSQQFDAVANTTSPGYVVGTIALLSGNNTVTVPSTATCATIIPPSGSSVVLTLKGVNGDTGIIISPNSPTSLGLSGVSSFVLNAASGVSVQLIYS